MIKFITYKSTLFYYDGPKVIEARDEIGGHYLGTVFDSESNGFKYLIVGVNPARLYALRRGEVDLCTLMKESSEFGWYTCETYCLEDPLILQDQGTIPVPDEKLPVEDFYLSEPINQQNPALLEATNRENFVLQLKIQPKDYHQRNRLSVRCHSELIVGLEELFKSVTDQPRTTHEKSAVGLDVVASATPGSLIVLLEASKTDVDIFDPPHRLLIKALEQVDDVVRCTDEVEHIRKIAKNHGVDFAKKFIRILKVLNRSKVDLSYSWAEPRFQSNDSNQFKFSVAKKLVHSMQKRSREILETKTHIVQGSFVSFSQQSGTWGLNTDDGVIKGKIDKDKLHNGLDGLVVGKSYIFECTATHTFGLALTNEEPTLVLQRILED
ncbi:MAG: hypothetical protein OXO49_00455 [Gammaproteobacteria bacterium]|nr:hypothetical protein [Gammaproteobacteria bacterium]MDE0251453.1 hypothetical protein [Gammaproteobacteria bacterium]MDE0401864.1 hypothetical protein [Gammaproteobacteria bacterium]